MAKQNEKPAENQTTPTGAPTGEAGAVTSTNQPVAETGVTSLDDAVKKLEEKEAAEKKAQLEAEEATNKKVAEEKKAQEEAQAKALAEQEAREKAEQEEKIRQRDLRNTNAALSPTTGEKPAEAPIRQIGRLELKTLVDKGDIDVDSVKGYVNNKTGERYYL